MNLTYKHRRHRPAGRANRVTNTGLSGISESLYGKAVKEPSYPNDGQRRCVKNSFWTQRATLSLQVFRRPRRGCEVLALRDQATPRPCQPSSRCWTIYEQLAFVCCRRTANCGGRPSSPAPLSPLRHLPAAANSAEALCVVSRQRPCPSPCVTSRRPPRPQPPPLRHLLAPPTVNIHA